MEWNIESIIFYVLLLDSLLAFFMAFTGKQYWWTTHLGTFARHFPLSKGWTALYLALVLLIGSILYTNNLLITI